MQPTTSKARRAPTDSERLRRRIERAVDRFGTAEHLWPADGRMLVGVSGGPDSTALLLVLHSLTRRRNLSLTIGYFDHQLRGPAAAQTEREAVEALAARTGCELVAGGADVRGLAKSRKLSLEEAARRARYEFLAAAAEERGIATVAVGHTADDQAETVLMHIIRGSGLAGIAGMGSRSRWPSPGHEGLVLARPLLHTSRAETVAYCRAARVHPLEDESNASAAYFRNRIRADLLPLLREYNAAVVDAVGRLADATRGDLQVLEDLASGAIAESREESEVRLERDRLRALPAALQRHAVRRAVLQLLGDLQGFGEKHLNAVAALGTATPGGRALRLPRGVQARAEGGVLVLTTAPAVPARKGFEAVALSVPGRARTGGLVFEAGARPLPDATASVEVDAAAVGRSLCVRPWRAGDRMQPAGMKGTKKLQDLFVDAGVPREQRHAIPVFESEGGIVWVAGLRLAEWARPQGSETVVLSFLEEDRS